MRVEVDRFGKQIMIGMSEGNRKRGRQHTRWMDAIRADEGRVERNKETGLVGDRLS